MGRQSVVRNGVALAVAFAVLALLIPGRAAAATLTQILWFAGSPGAASQQLWLTDATGANPQLLSASFVPKAYPKFVIGGTLYGTFGASADTDLVKFALDGSTTKVADLCPGAALDRLAPAGEGRIAVACGSLGATITQPSTVTVYVEDVDGTNATPVAGGLTNVADLASDGTNVVYTVITGPFSVFTQPIAGGAATSLFGSQTGSSPVGMSAANGVLAYAQAGQVFTVPIAGGTPRMIASADSSLFDPSVSPDGSAVLYEAPKGGCATDELVVPTHGGVSTLLTGTGRPYVPQGQCAGAAGMWAPGMWSVSALGSTPATSKPVARLTGIQTHSSGRQVTVTARLASGQGTVHASAMSGRRHVTLQVLQSKTGVVTIRAKLAPGVWKIRITVKPARTSTAPKALILTVRTGR